MYKRFTTLINAKHWAYRNQKAADDVWFILRDNDAYHNYGVYAFMIVCAKNHAQLQAEGWDTTIICQYN
jgi:hypothetical protein